MPIIGSQFGSQPNETPLGQQGGIEKESGDVIGPIGGGLGGGGDVDPSNEPSIRATRLSSGTLTAIFARRNVFDFGQARLQVASSGLSIKSFSIQPRYSGSGMPSIRVSIGPNGLVGNFNGTVATIGPNAGRGSGSRSGYIIGDFTLTPGTYIISDGTTTQQVRVYGRSRFGIQKRISTEALGPYGETSFLAGTDVEPTVAASAGKGLVNQRKTKNVRRSFNRPPKGSVTIVTKTPKQS